MGIVARQGIASAIHISLGFALGAFNTLVLVPLVFYQNEADKDNWGLAQYMVIWATIFTQFLNFGSASIIVRWMPNFKAEKREGNSLFYAWIFPLAGAALLIPFLFVSSEWFFSVTSETPFQQTALVTFLILVIFICMNFTRSLNGLATARYRASLVAFVNELFIRILNIISVLLYYYEAIDIVTFFVYYALSFVFQFLLMFVLCGHFKLFRITIPAKKEQKEAVGYGIFSMFDQGVSFMVNKLDMAMIAAMIGLAEIAYYNLAFFMSTVIILPFRALGNISSSVVSDSYYRNDWKNIDVLYKKNSLNQFLSGGLIFILAWCSIDNILQTQPVDFAVAKYCFLFLGISKLFDAFTSINGIILHISKYYVMNFVFNVVLLVLAFITNLILIPYLELTGAALATAGCILLVNVMKSWFLYHKFRVHPFHRNTVLAFACFGIALLTGMYFPDVADSPLLNAVVRSGAIVFLFGTLVYFSKVSEDINAVINKILARLGIRR